MIQPSSVTMPPEKIRSRLAELGWWFHNVDLGQGIWTNPDDPRAYKPELRWGLIEPHVPDDLSGKTVLDLACNDGYYSVMMKRRGASRVLGIDVDESSLKRARFLAEVYGVDVEFRIEDVYRFCLRNTEHFDYVMFLGLFYHLRHPLLVLDHMAAIVRERLYFQSVIRGAQDTEGFETRDDYPIDETIAFENRAFPKMFFLEKRFNNDPTNWWIANGPGLIGVLRSAGFEVIQTVDPQVFVCKPVRKPKSVKVCDHVSFPVVEKD